MINLLVLVPILFGFLLTLFLVPYWGRKAKQIGLLWSDMNKFSKPKIPGSGGIMVVVSFIIAVFLYIAYRVFFLKATNSFLVEIFALLTVTLLLGGIGFFDDLLGKQGGLSRRSRIIAIFLAAIPLIAINAGKSRIVLPFLGDLNLGILYPLLFIPIGVIGATTTFNFLAGFNGLEAGQGILILSSMAIVSFFTGSPWLSIIALCMVFCLLAFLVFNFYPAKIFPGDSLTYAVGGLIATISILGSFEKIALFFFIPYILEFFLKSRGGLKKYSFGKPKEDGSLDLAYKKIYSLNHLSIYLMKKSKAHPTERKVVLSIWIFQLLIIILGFIIFRAGIFA